MLDGEDAEVVSERSARKDPLTDKDARALLKRVSRVIVARGKKSETFDARKTRLDDLRGPSGKFRAPLLIKGKTLLVGFNEDALRRLV